MGEAEARYGHSTDDDLTRDRARRGGGPPVVRAAAAADRGHPRADAGRAPPGGSHDARGGRGRALRRPAAVRRGVRAILRLDGRAAPRHVVPHEHASRAGRAAAAGRAGRPGWRRGHAGDERPRARRDDAEGEGQGAGDARARRRRIDPDQDPACGARHPGGGALRRRQDVGEGRPGRGELRRAAVRREVPSRRGGRLEPRVPDPDDAAGAAAVRVRRSGGPRPAQAPGDRSLPGVGVRDHRVRARRRVAHVETEGDRHPPRVFLPLSTAVRRRRARDARPRRTDDDARSAVMSVFRWIFAAAVVALVGMMAMRGLAPRVEPPVPVQIAKAQKATITRTVSAAGKLEPVDKVNVSSNITGILVDLQVAIGSVVKKGQYLGQIDTSRYKAQLDQQRAQTDAAVADIRRAAANLAKLKAEEERQQALVAKGAGNKSDYENAHAAVQIAQAELSQSQSRADVARGALSEAQSSFTWATLKAPIDGTVLATNHRVGERIRGSDFSEDVVLVIGTLDRVNVRIEIGEHDVVFVKPGQLATVEVDALP